MPDAHKNFASSLVATAPSPATSGTSLVVTTGDGTKFPAAPFNATIWPAGATPSTANAEIVRVTAVSTDTLTITRAQESTSARTVIVGDQIVASITAKTLTDVEASAQTFSGFYGDGSDGNVTVTGGTTTLTRDMFYDTLTVSGTGILKPAGFRVYCKTGLIVQASGSVNLDGQAGSGATAGGATNSTSGSMGNQGGLAGGAGGTAGGTSASTPSNSYGGIGGNGGLGPSGAGGFGRTPTLPAAAAGSVRSAPWAALGILTSATSIINLNGGSGGGGGGGDATNSGGGGGGGGGIMILNARTVTNSGTITATGGVGGSATTGNAGGGGGGGGGMIIVNTSQAITGSAPTAAGGSGGAKTGTGVAGVAGQAGSVFVNVWS